MRWVSLKDIIADRDWRALSVITPFLVRYKWQVATALLSLTLASSAGGRSYKFLSMAGPGWVLFKMPSRPAITTDAKHR